jgi:hypothetical protein
MRNDGTLIDGHGRVKAAKRLGMTSIPALVCQEGEELTPEMEKAFRISVNELATKADWDQDKLTQELESLKDKFNLDELSKLTSFDLDLLDDLLADELGAPETNEPVGITQLTNEVQFPTTPPYDFPKLLDCWYDGPCPQAWLGDDSPGQHHLYIFSTDSAIGLPWERTIISFWTADGKFERIYKDTASATQKLLAKTPAGIVTPDFSVFHTAPLPERLMAAYQSLYIGRYLQEAGLKIIVNVSTCSHDAQGFFESLPANVPLARQIQASMQPGDVQNERIVLEEMAKFHPRRAWIYAPDKVYRRFEKELLKIDNVEYITPRFWARQKK